MRISFKLLGFSEAVLLVALIALVVPAFLAMRNQIITQIQLELKATAANAAPLLDGDLHRKVEAGGPDAQAAFESMRDVLQAIRDRNVLEPEWIYTLYRDDDIVRFGVMTHEKPFTGDEYVLQPGMVPVLTDGASHATDLYRDEHGEWISAYAPIRDSRGAIVGLLEVDRPAEKYFMSLKRLAWITLGIAGPIVLVVSSVLGWRILNGLVISPMRSIRAGVVALGRQDFAHHVEVKTRDEFQDLGDTLNQIAKQLNAAKVVQASFFPKRMPEHPRYRLAGTSIPCDAVGGDYFDAYELERGRIAVVLADVSGHGLGPSLLMATCRSAVRALSAADLAPGELVERLNVLLLDDLADGRFITFLYGVLDPDGRFVFANAGHGPAMVAHNGSLRHLASHRPPLGIDLGENGVGEETRIDLRPGDRILLASDGLSEAMSTGGDYFGVEPIERAATERGLGADDVVDRLQSELLEHCDGPSTTDDVTILCVDRV